MPSASFRYVIQVISPPSPPFAALLSVTTMTSIALELEGPVKAMDELSEYLSTTPPKAYGERIANIEEMRKNHQERVARIKREQRQTKGTDNAEEGETIIKNEE